ncbi:MAG: sodium-dependent transporter [Bacteroidaceae bacterium]|nr:sodium-dependent transporter [Bacteroidaceae bacterium]
MNKANRENFGSKLGIILVSAGSAVGLGNVWRFPSELGQNGGAAFLFVYFLCLIFLGLPIMISEFIIGRRSKTNAATAFRILAPGTKWQCVGYMGVLCGFIIIGFYSVVAGWILDYIYESATFHFSKVSDFSANFTGFISNPWKPLVCLFIFLIINHFIIIRGVQKGIEKFSKIMMPMLFVIVIALAVFSLTLPGAAQGLEFLFSPDFSKISSGVVLSAMGQAFFSLSIGMGCLCTYASYFTSDTRLPQTALTVCIIDTFIALISGLIIFPAVFTSGLSPDAGSSLVFITFPNIIQTAFGNMPVVCYAFSLMFYVLLAIAALTSVISLYEVVTAYISEGYSMSRKKATVIVTVFSFIIGIVSSLSFGVLSDIKIFDMSFFDFLDYVTAKIMMPIGGMLISAFVGWYLDRKIVWEELSNNILGTEEQFRAELVRGKRRKHRFFYLCFRGFIFILRYFAPVAIGLVFIDQLGLF